MYDRCYSKRYHDRSPQYIGCSMCDDWLDDQATFKERAVLVPVSDYIIFIFAGQ